MENDRKSIYIFSSELPNGYVDAFMLPELEEICKKDLKITLFPYNENSEKSRELNSKVSLNYCMSDFDESKYKIGYSLLLLFLKVLRTDLKYNKGAFWKTIISLRRTFSYFKSMYFRADFVNESFSFESNAIFYSYWWEEWNLILIILKLRGKLVNSTIISRAHGYDLYTERQNNYILFRGAQLIYTDRIYTISKNGENYLKGRYPSFDKKIFSYYLGTSDHGYGKESSNSKEYLLLSVSDFREVKRVWLIPEILKNMNIKVKWIHVGGGKDLDEFKERIKQIDLPSCVSYEFKGFIENEDLFNLYKNNAFHLFINVSSNEGLPISIMEAISAGVPAVATNVGGTNEIITNETGLLIEKDFEPSEVAKKITNFLQSLNEDKFYRQRIRKFWENHFKAASNNSKFVNHLFSE